MSSFVIGVSVIADEPVKNLKKLLEIYAEVLAINQSSVTNKILIERLNKWNSSGGLKRVIKQIDDRVGNILRNAP